MLKSFFWSKGHAFYAWAVLACILAITWYNVEILVYYNTWNKQFYDAIQNLQEAEFWQLLWGFSLNGLWSLITLKEGLVPSFLEIIIVYTPMSAFVIWLSQRFAFRWREANTQYYLERWERSTAKIEGGSQRIQEDLMLFGKTLQSLFTGFFNAVLVLFAFLPILWQLSEGLPVWNGQVIPGFLVWVALAVSVGGTLFSFLLGLKLPGLEYNNQVVEAKFRKHLVFSEDDYSYRLTQDLFPMFAAIKKNYHKLFNWYFSFSVWQTAFGLVVGNLAIIVLAPSYFAQLITLGILFQVLNAFGRVENSLSFFIDRWTTIVDFQAVVRRIREFDKTLTEHDTGK